MSGSELLRHDHYLIAQADKARLLSKLIDDLMPAEVTVSKYRLINFTAMEMTFDQIREVVPEAFPPRLGQQYAQRFVQRLAQTGTHQKDERIAPAGIGLRGFNETRLRKGHANYSSPLWTVRERSAGLNLDDICWTLDQLERDRTFIMTSVKGPLFATPLAVALIELVNRTKDSDILTARKLRFLLEREQQTPAVHECWIGTNHDWCVKFTLRYNVVHASIEHEDGWLHYAANQLRARLDMIPEAALYGSIGRKAEEIIDFAPLAAANLRVTSVRRHLQAGKPTLLFGVVPEGQPILLAGQEAGNISMPLQIAA